MAKKKQADFLKWMGPILDALRELGGSGSPKEFSSKVAEMLHIPDSVLEEKLKSGVPRFRN